MRIGVIAPPWLPIPPRRYGGTENVIDGLCRGLVVAGHQVTLVASMGSRCPVPTIPLRVGSYEQMGSATVEVPYVLRAYRALSDAEVDVIHDHTAIGFLLDGDLSIPVITTNHNLFDPERCEIYREAAARSVRVAAISEHHARTGRNALVPIAGVVHNGIDVNAVPVGKGDGGYAAVLSRMSPTKGIREAILIARNAGIPVRIAAKMQTPAERQYFNDQIRPLLDGNTEYESEVSAREKYELLGGAVALLNPIQWPEPFGMAMIESLACGTPVLATAAGSAPEIIDHGSTGMLRGHWAGLAADLERIANLDRAACRRTAEQRFGIDRMAAGYLDLYQALIHREEAA